MKTLYLDLFSGISGDMFIGALIDLGVDSRALEHELEKLDVGGYHLHIGKATKGTISGTKFNVHVTRNGSEHTHGHDRVASDHDHDHGHTHAHAHGHSHEHSHTHAADHSHDEEHSHATFGEIREVIQHSGLSDWVKTR